MLRRTLLSGLLLSAALLVGCGGKKAGVQPMIDEFSSYEKDVMALSPLPPAPLALAKADAARNKADGCLQRVDRAREGWNEVILMLEQTERVAARGVSEISREEPELPAQPPLPPTTISGAAVPTMTTAELRPAFAAWRDLARNSGQSAGDLETRFNDRIGLADLPKGKDLEKARHRYVAARTLQEMEARVREQRAVELCAESIELASRFGEYREQALRATLELERSLKDNLKVELDAARAEAEARQSDLYESLQKLEGRFASIKKTARGTIVSLADILFDFGKATLKRDVEFNLVKIATILEQYPEMQIAVEGHTDNVGSEEYNMELSRKRAQAVADFMVTQGLSNDRLTVAGYGFSRPLEDNSTETGRQKNRRVDLVINE
ncbi:MAG: OmpA/MotB domain-containing protein [bacterium]|nr:MAG: OmpA/MotB domain-containing protein [bacterium]